MMTLEECLFPINTGKLVWHLRRHLTAILTNETYEDDDGDLYIKIIKQNGISYNANPYYLTLMTPADLLSDYYKYMQ